MSVSDTGIGIPEDKLDGVFEKFNQVDNTSTRRHEGTGLGLTIFSLLIEKMEGARGLEWTVPSPAPLHTFDTPPVVDDSIEHTGQLPEDGEPAARV